MTLPAVTEESYLRYSDGLEQREPDETAICEQIMTLMSQSADAIRRQEGHPERISHVTAHGAVIGKLIVNRDLPERLRQGLFAQPGKRYDALIRLAHTPGEFVEDRQGAAAHGIAIKILGTDGDQLAGHATTQDFLLDTGKTFLVSGARTFLHTLRSNDKTAQRRKDTGLLSTAAAREAHGAHIFLSAETSQRDPAGQPFLHPLAESYYSQAPFRYGSYVAKFCVEPVTPGLKELAGRQSAPHEAAGLRADVVEFFRTHDAEYVFGVQLAGNLDDFPIENANAQWPEGKSPFRAVARLAIPAQDAYEEKKVQYIESLSFSPAHSLAAHRPLGSLNRARMHTYAAIAQKRRNELGETQIEPDSIAQFPA